jgi:hypothetical protein
MVAMVPMASLTTSLDSGLRSSLGKLARSRTPNKAPPKTQAKTIKLIAKELMLDLSPAKNLDAPTSTAA